jgi:gliding motility-associated-like protein
MRCILAKLVFTFLISIVSIYTQAAHIVGGDFSYLHVTGDTYQFKMKMYRDCGGGGAPFENSLIVGIYNKETNTLVQRITMPRIRIYPIKFNTGCTSPELRCVETGVFRANVTLPKNLYNNTEGYYIQWERCCRNDIIKNIVDPGSTPMAFYMEFPSPYPGNGSFRANSSPEFLRDPLNYLCVGEPFKYDFKIYDGDGDELRMKIGVPNAGRYTSIFSPGQNTGPAPYDDIIWKPGYGIGSKQNIMDGNPDLYVDNDTAFIYLVPKQIGVYIISVICEEYRDNVKIGEVVRELQLEVLNCPPRSKPNIFANLPNGNSFVDVVVGQKVCFDITATDLDVAELLKFRFDTSGLFKSIGATAGLSPADTTGTESISAKFCWTPTCPIDTSNGTFIDIIAYDNSCPFSQDDTVRINFRITELPNINPVLKTNLNTNVLNVRPNETICFQFLATDSNAIDQIVIEPISENIDVFELGATVTPNILSGNTRVSGEFCWTPDCKLKLDSPINLSLVVSDNACPIPAFDTVKLKINLLPLLNEAPFIEAQGLNIGANNTIFVRFDEQNCFSIYAEDADEDDISIYTRSVNYEFFENGARFDLKQDLPNAKLGTFCWTPTCDNFYGEDELFVDFFTRDNKCDNEKYDSVRIRFLFQLPDNINPLLLRPDSLLYNINAGYSRAIDVMGTDEDQDDLLVLDARPLYDASIPMRIEMNKNRGFGSVESQLIVYPDCGLDGNIDYPVEVKLFSNKYCRENDTITKVIYFRAAPLLDIDRPLVPDVFTPNGDGINDEYKIYMANRTVCPDEFEFIIYNRWGQKLLETRDPEFVWKAEGASVGAYVYYLRLGETKYTGTISLVK